MEDFFLKSIEHDLQQLNLPNWKIYDLMVLFKEGIEVLKKQHGNLDEYDNDQLYIMLTSWLKEELTLL